MSDANGHDLESGKLNGGDYADADHMSNNPLTKTITITPEMFERMYLSPKGQTAGDLRKRFANPTPLALMGFSVGLLPLSVEFSKLILSLFISQSCCLWVLT